MTRYRALLVGNGTFPKDPHTLQTLIGPSNDVDQLGKWLSDPDSGLFSPDEITTVRDQPSYEVIRELAKFFSRARKDDVLLFYYSGHGRLDLQNVLYLCTLDAQTDLLEATTVSSVRVKEFVDRTPATNTIIMLDCCHSGAYKGNDIARALKHPKSYVMTSCRQDDLANDASALSRTSMFTEQVIDGLARASAHGPSSDHLTIEELFGYVRDGLEARGRQIPQFITRGDGDLPIARRRAVPSPSPSARPEVTLRVSETLLDLGEVSLDDVLPVERVYVTARTAGGWPARWTARTSASWVSLSRQTDPDRLELDIRPSPGGGRTNVEVRNEDTGDVVTVRIAMRLRTSPLSQAASYDQVTEAATPDPAPFPRSNLRDFFGSRTKVVGGGTLDLSDDISPVAGPAEPTAVPPPTGSGLPQTYAELAVVVEQSSFSKPPFGKRGYDSGEVDDFLDEVVRSVRSGNPMRPADVHNVAFKKPPIGKRGYDEDDVDMLLDVVEAALARLAG